jgi:hypothetical protein
MDSNLIRPPTVKFISVVSSEELGALKYTVTINRVLMMRLFLLGGGGGMT